MSSISLQERQRLSGFEVDFLHKNESSVGPAWVLWLRKVYFYKIISLRISNLNTEMCSHFLADQILSLHTRQFIW